MKAHTAGRGTGLQVGIYKYISIAILLIVFCFPGLSLTRKKKAHCWGTEKITGIISVTVWQKSKELMMESALSSLLQK